MPLSNPEELERGSGVSLSPVLAGAGAAGRAASQWQRSAAGCIPALMRNCGAREAIIPDALGSCINTCRRPGRRAVTAGGLGQGGGGEPLPHTGVGVLGLSSRRAEVGWTNGKALLVTQHGLCDMGSVTRVDGQQLPRMAVLAGALERLLAAPVPSWSCSPGLTLVAEFVAAATSCLPVKTFVSVA